MNPRVPAFALFMLVLLAVGVGASAPFLGGSTLSTVSGTFGRDETLTGRTETWEQLVPVATPVARGGLRQFLDDRQA